VAVSVRRALVIIVSATVGVGWLAGACHSSESPAIAAVRHLAGSPELPTLLGTQDYLAGKLERYSSKSSSGTVIDYYYDPSAKRVVRQDDFSPVKGDVTVGVQQAEATAEEFARGHIPFFVQGGMTLSSSVDAAANPSSPGLYSFTWTKSDPLSGAVLPTFLAVDVDGSTGKVKSFVSLDVPVTIPTRPQISKDAAIAAARSALGDVPSGARTDAVLKVGGYPPGDTSGKLTLMWAVTLSVTLADGTVTGGVVYVDANQGAVLGADPFL
jgi:hypothetical protein